MQSTNSKQAKISIDSVNSEASKNDDEGAYNRIIQLVNEHKKEHRDNDDNSVHPSYTRFQLP